MKKRITIITSLIAAWLFLLLCTQFTIPGIVLQFLVFALLPRNPLFFIIPLALLTVAALVIAARKRRGIVICVVVLMILAIPPFNGALWSAREHSRDARMRKLQVELEELRQNGSPPDDLSGPGLRELSKGPFGTDRIRYLRSNAHYTIESYGVPLGPFHLFSSDKQRWYCEE